MLCCLDAVSSFPYYDPGDVDALTTVSGKQLNGPAGLGIVVLSPRVTMDRIRLDLPNGSCTNLFDHLAARDRGESLHTPPVETLEDLWTALTGFDLDEFRRKIDDRRAYLTRMVSVFDDPVMPLPIIGQGPVVTFRKGFLPDSFVQENELYVGDAGPQMFLHYRIDNDGVFNDFLKSMKEALSCRSR
jgi:hypothetical protein